MPDTPQNESGEATITTAHGERITYRRNNETGYWTATQEGMPDSWWLSRVASRAVDEIVALRSRLAEVERKHAKRGELIEGLSAAGEAMRERAQRAEQRVAELERLLRDARDDVRRSVVCLGEATKDAGLDPGAKRVLSFHYDALSVVEQKIDAVLSPSTTQGTRDAG